MAAKKAIAKKTVTKAKTKTKAVAKPVAAPKKLPAIKEKYTKSAIIAEISANADLSKKQVTAVFQELNDLIARHVKKGAVGEFTLPGLLKIKTVKKPASKARKGVPNPFRPGEVMNVAAKPASTKVKVLPLKGLKELA
ncbi:HU family DNA-binding protein [Pseudomonadales bacterium]|nr:HU family DNA-binding protein [Pseudomonadales bacterium]MDB4150912.1 HU family DNA-binding protein [Pseudomonadales bacterium]MDB9868151.1 HU family DNA-binding protein [Pseudomonadales bacterium]MDB9916873.1 HU family DNA-binding protein [Pseudomonadales bacterium]MDC1368798.1 HU family DNA-binding protein [Pseudomonadales bacterium]|tara:strand:+ start:185 stop:598 length:414 start_codon:yes stop_codon:yes gene_type:complete